jgi:hypothetical protein
MNKIVTNNISIENAKIIFRNFSGRETQVNSAGDRNFCAVIEDQSLIDQLTEDGWNLKILEGNEEYGDAPKHILKVAVSFKNIPPKIYMVTKKNKTLLTEETVGTLDYADIKNIDLIIAPYNWEMLGKSGVKAYLKTMYVVIEEDEFAYKYVNNEDNDDEGVPF